MYVYIYIYIYIRIYISHTFVIIFIRIYDTYIFIYMCTYLYKHICTLYAYPLQTPSIHRKTTIFSEKSHRKYKFPNSHTPLLKPKF